MRDQTKAGLQLMRTAILGSVVLLGACAPTYRSHGYIPPQDQLDAIKIGSDTRESVAEKVGVPASSGILNSSGYYYVRARTREIGPLGAREIERQVVAISFAQSGTVQNVERFGLEQGRVVQLERRVTSSSVDNKSFIRQLLGNLGRFNPVGLGG